LSGQVIKHDKLEALKSKKLREIGLKNNMKLPEIGIFKEFTRKDLRQLFFSSNIIDLAAEEFLFQAGEFDNAVYILLRGELLVIKPSGRETSRLILATLQEADHFNETSIFYNGKHEVSIQAKTDSVLMQIPRAKALEILQENSALSNKLLWRISTKLSERLRNTTEKLSTTYEKSSDISGSMEEE
jgi:CRP-like cAMP-binding protein